MRLVHGSGEDSEEFETQARDLSATGAYIYLDDPRLGVGDHVEVEIRLTVKNRTGDDGGPIQIAMSGSGEIRRVDPSGLALAFDHRLRFT